MNIIRIPFVAPMSQLIAQVFIVCELWKADKKLLQAISSNRLSSF